MPGTISRRDSAPVSLKIEGHRQRSRGGAMRLKAALIVLAACVAGVLGLYDAGSLVDILLLTGYMMLLLGVLKAGDAAASGAATTKPSVGGVD